MIDLNPGTRNSLLALDRLATGELDDAAADAVRGRLSDRDRAHLVALDAAPRRAFDPAAIRARAAALPSPVEAPPTVAPANTTWAFVAALLALAAVVLLAARLTLPTATDPGPGEVRFKSGDALEVVQLVGDAPRDYVAGTAVGEGTVLGFRVNATGHSSVVVLSVDGRGQTTVFWPASGDEAEPLSGDGLVSLEGSVVLDDAPGPEVFVAVYDRSVPDAVHLVEAAWSAGGAREVLTSADGEPGVHAVEVTRR